MKANQINHVKIKKDQQVPKDYLILQSQSHLPFGRTSLKEWTLEEKLKMAELLTKALFTEETMLSFWMLRN